MKTLVPLFVTLVLQGVLTAIEASLGVESVRVEPAFAVIAFTAVRLDPVAGVMISSAIGLTTDLMCASPPGLHMLAFTAVYLVARGLSAWLGFTRPVAALPLVLLLAPAARLFIVVLLALFAEESGRVSSWSALLGASVVDALLAVPIWSGLELAYARLAEDLEPLSRNP